MSLRERYRQSGDFDESGKFGENGEFAGFIKIFALSVPFSQAHLL